MILNILAQTLGFIGALCLLLFGMSMLSDGIQKGAGKELQHLLGKIAGNRFTALLTGIAITTIVQSSGATTVMVVSFVNAEILTLNQAIGVIFGANIGTTVTAWIVSFFGFSFSISAAAIPIFGLGYLLKKFKKLKIHNFADCFMGFALLFMGLDLLKASLSLDPSSAGFLKNLSSLKTLGLFIGVIIGAFVTALIHSSSATTAIVLTMAANGSLSWELSASLVLGSNIGSTIDAVMSAMGATTNAKRTALVHVGFNTAGTLIILCFFKPFLALVDAIVPGSPESAITTHIAMLHTIFNLLATLIFLPFINQIATLTKKIIKDSKKETESHYTLPAILPSTRANAEIYTFQIQKEISKMSARVMEMMDMISLPFSSQNAAGEKALEVVDKIKASENYIDEMNESITDFLQGVYNLPNATSEERKNFSKLISITDNLENLSDECDSIMNNLTKYLAKASRKDSSTRLQEAAEYFSNVKLFYEQACIYYATGISESQRNQGKAFEIEINKNKKALKKASRKRIESGSDVKAELAYIDLIRKIEKAGDCVYALVREF